MKVYAACSVDYGLVEDSKHHEIIDMLIDPSALFSTPEKAKVYCQDEVNEYYEGENETPPTIEWQEKTDSLGRREWGAFIEPLRLAFAIYEREVDK